MAALALQTGVCTGHACWPPMGYGPSLAQTVRVTKIAPLHDTVVRLPHCKPCGKNPACHPGAVVASTKTVLAGTDVPGIPLVVPKSGDPETEAILTALAPKLCATRLPIARISDSCGCGSAVAVGAPNVLLGTGAGAATSMAKAAVAGGVGAVAAIGAAAAIFTIAGMAASMLGSAGGGGGGGSSEDPSFDIDEAAGGAQYDPSVTKTIGGRGGLSTGKDASTISTIICD